MVQLPSEFRARLETYRGPLDLLLYLIKKDELDIFDIPISRITEQYLVFLQVLKNIDPNLCGDFLVTAAQLMEIKSKTLLPIESLDEEGEDLDDPRLELILQLLEYKKYKDRALLLEQMVDEHSQKYRRPEQDLALLDNDDAGLPDLGKVSIWDLLTAFQRVQLALSQRQPHRVLFEDRPVEEYIRDIRARFARDETSAPGSRILFETLLEESGDRYDAIGFLLAVLEMAKQGEIRFHQEEIFGPISLELVQAARAAVETATAQTAAAGKAVNATADEPPAGAAGITPDEES